MTFSGKKPDPEAFVKAMQALGVGPLEAVALEDSPGGVAAALGVLRADGTSADHLEAALALPLLDDLRCGRSPRMGIHALDSAGT